MPIAAALNWILKDGLGQLGGVVCAAFINNRFDADPKFWRFVASLAEDAACTLEVLTPLLPGAFLPLAALANVGKNISFLATSATRAQMNQWYVHHHHIRTFMILPIQLYCIRDS